MKGTCFLSLHVFLGPIAEIHREAWEEAIRLATDQVGERRSVTQNLESWQTKAVALSREVEALEAERRAPAKRPCLNSALILRRTAVARRDCQHISVDIQ